MESVNLTTLLDLLARYPEARVAALLPDGRPAQVPSWVPLGTSHTAIVTPGLAGYLPEDRSKVLVAWDRTLRTGVGHARARAFHAPDVALELHMVDVRAEEGSVVLVVIVIDDSLEGDWSPVQTVPHVAHRVARIKKEQTSSIVEVDEATCLILGWSAAEMVGRRSLEFIHPADQPVAIENWLHLAAEPGCTVRSRLRHQARDGSWVWFETSQSFISGASPPLILAEMVDVSGEMAAQLELVAREQFLTQLTHTLPVGVLQVDRAGRLVYSNERLFEILGRTLATVEELIAALQELDQPRLREALADVLGGRPERSLDIQLAELTDGVPRSCTFSFRPLDEDGHVTGVVGSISDISDGVRLRNELERRAMTDGLTQCLNRWAIRAHLKSTLARRIGEQLVVIAYVDLDQFKEVNDQLGHAAGDDLLCHAAQRLIAGAGSSAAVGRLGGDEFLIVRDDLTSDEEITEFRHDVATALAGRVVISGKVITPTASVGIAWSSQATDSIDALIAEADARMYHEKRANRVPCLPTARAAV